MKLYEYAVGLFQAQKDVIGDFTMQHLLHLEKKVNQLLEGVNGLQWKINDGDVSERCVRPVIRLEPQIRLVKCVLKHIQSEQFMELSLEEFRRGYLNLRIHLFLHISAVYAQNKNSLMGFQIVRPRLTKFFLTNRVTSQKKLQD